MQYDISRFETMYAEYFDTVKAELSAGRKQSHWMWFIFPQIQGLGSSEMSVRYAIRDVGEAKAFLAGKCGKQMLELIDILLQLPTKDAVAVFGPVDAAKLRSSMTLFSTAAPENPCFQQMLDKFFGGCQDEKTIEKFSNKNKEML